MIKARIFLLGLVTLLTAGLGLTACEKLGGNDAIREVLPGQWSFSYTTSEELDLEFEYELVVFQTDGSCSINSETEELNGTYRASDDVVVIDADHTPNDKPMLWKILSFSPYRIVAEYEFEDNGQSVTATIYLEKV